MQTVQIRIPWRGKSAAIGSRKRKRMSGRSNGACAKLVPEPNQKPTDSLKRLNEEGKVSAAIASRKRKHRGGQAEKANASSTCVADMPFVRNQIPSAPKKDMNMEGKQSGASASRKRKNMEEAKLKELVLIVKVLLICHLCRTKIHHFPERK